MLNNMNMVVKATTNRFNSFYCEDVSFQNILLQKRYALLLNNIMVMVTAIIFCRFHVHTHQGKEKQ